MVDQSEENCEFNELQTRAAAYQKQMDFSSNTVCNSSPQKSARNKVYLPCKIHNPKSKTKKEDSWCKENEQCSSCVKFNSLGEFQTGKLPRFKDVLERILTLRLEQSNSNKGETVKKDSYRETFKEIIIHWIYCNLYPLTINAVIQRVKKLFDDYDSLRNYPHTKKKDTFWNNYDIFIKKLDMLFDVLAGDEYRKKQEHFWKVKMSDIEMNFYHNQAKCPPVGYCDTFVSRRDSLSDQRRYKRENRVRNENFEFAVVSTTDMVVDGEHDMLNNESFMNDN